MMEMETTVRTGEEEQEEDEDGDHGAKKDEEGKSAEKEEEEREGNEVVMEENEMDAVEFEGKQGDDLQQPSIESVPGGEQTLEEFMEVFELCYAHPIQYGEDLRLAAARGIDEKVEPHP